MRLFTAIALSEKQKKEVLILQNRLREYLEGVRWVRPEALHLTLKFLGETDEAVLPAVKEAMDETTADEGRFSVSLRKSGVFPGPSKARVLWVGLDDSAPLVTALAEKLDRNLSGKGFAPEKRPYRPHLTIGRLRYPLPKKTIEKFISEENSFQSSPVTAEEIVLFESKLLRDGAVYRPLYCSTFKKSPRQ